MNFYTFSKASSKIANQETAFELRFILRKTEVELLVKCVNTCKREL